MKQATDTSLGSKWRCLFENQAEELHFLDVKNPEQNVQSKLTEQHMEELKIQVEQQQPKVPFEWMCVCAIEI